MSTDTIGCVKAATKILGDKWTPQLLRFFVNEETVRFCQIQGLEQEGIISKIQATEKSRCEYRLTEKGKELTPILRDMQAWSDRHATTSAV